MLYTSNLTTILSEGFKYLAPFASGQRPIKHERNAIGLCLFSAVRRSINPLVVKFVKYYLEDPRPLKLLRLYTSTLTTTFESFRCVSHFVSDQRSFKNGLNATGLSNFRLYKYRSPVNNFNSCKMCKILVGRSPTLTISQIIHIHVVNNIGKFQIRSSLRFRSARFQTWTKRDRT